MPVSADFDTGNKNHKIQSRHQNLVQQVFMFQSQKEISAGDS